MKVQLHHPARAIELHGPKRVRDLLTELKIVPETVLVIRGDELVTEDEPLKDEDAIEIRPVISGGAPRKHFVTPYARWMRCGVWIVGLVLTGCATMINGTKQTVSFTSEPSGATVTVGRVTTRTPATIPLRRGKTYHVAIAKEGYETANVAMNSRFSHWIQATLGNSWLLHVSLIPGLFVDTISGGAYDFDQPYVNVTLRESTTAARKTPRPVTLPSFPSDIDRPVFGTTEKIMGDRDVAVVIGVEKYQDLPAAEYAAGDAALVKEYLVALGFRDGNIQLLVDEKATQSSIKKTVETWLANRVKKESRVVVYYSGHGSPDPATGAAYLVPHDGDPNYLADTGYPLKTLYEKLGALPAQEVVVLLDACFSGAGGRSVLAKGARPMVVTKEGGVLPPNMVVLAASQAAQISTSSAEKGHGLFTYHFLKALKNGKKDVVEIYQHIQPLVEDEAKALNVTQSPNMNPEPRLAQARFRLRN